MKLKLVIENQLEEELYTQDYDPTINDYVRGIRRIEPYDEEKWKNGTVYEFDTLKEMFEFIDSCDIDFTKEYAESFGQWSWEEIDIDYYICPTEYNLMLLRIGSHPEWRD